MGERKKLSHYLSSQCLIYFVFLATVRSFVHWLKGDIYKSPITIKINYLYLPSMNKKQTLLDAASITGFGDPQPACKYENEAQRKKFRRKL